ncbi:unnamed protein product, partial [Didymodactylos carnosus]
MLRKNVKQRVILETTPIMKIYEEEVVKAQLSTQALATIPMAREIQAGLAQARRQITPVLPTSSTFDIPDAYQVTSKSEKFLFSDTLIRRRKRMLLFGSVTQLELLFDSPTIFMDGTFSSTPPFFDQVYTIHAMKFGTSFPCVFGLLPDRKKSMYQQLFKVLQDLAISMNRTFKPDRILSDFEPSLIPAVASEFPQAVHSGCFYHYTQAIYRRMQILGLTIAYSQNDEIRICCRKLMALALLPLDKVEWAFHDLRTKPPAAVNQTLHQLFLYFEKQWMTDVPLEIWNVQTTTVK